jgi:hypothetical protein
MSEVTALTIACIILSVNLALMMLVVARLERDRERWKAACIRERRMVTEAFERGRNSKRWSE